MILHTTVHNRKLLSVQGKICIPNEISVSNLFQKSMPWTGESCRGEAFLIGRKKLNLSPCRPLPPQKTLSSRMQRPVYIFSLRRSSSQRLISRGVLVDSHLHFRVSHLEELLGGHVCLCMISINSSILLENTRKSYWIFDGSSPPSWCCPPPLPCRWTPGSCQSEWWSCGHTELT